MTTEPKKYWFPAKRYGWGWSFPVAWQGWAVLVGYLVIVVFAPRLFAGRGVGFFPLIAIATALLVGVCVLKGEPPGSRSGK